MRLEVITVPEEIRKGFGFGTLVACQNVVDSLKQSFDDVRLSVCENEKDLYGVVKRKPDLVVLAVKHVPFLDGKEIWLADFFEKSGIAYTGSCKNAMEHDVDKESAKKQMNRFGIRTARYLTSVPGKYSELTGLPMPYPLFLKPLAGADSLGVDEKSIVRDFSEFEVKVRSIYEKDYETVLVEQYLPGREFTVALIESKDALLVAAIEIIPPEKNGVRILSEKVKSQDTESLQQVFDAKLLVKISNLARRAFNALDARDFARIDIKMDKEGECHFMEANLTPGMNKGSSYFTEAFEMSLGMNYDEVVSSIIQNALKRITV